MAVSSVGFAELFMLLALFSGGGVIGPYGVTPLPEDPVISQVAPEDCLFYISWTGLQQTDVNASCSTEKLFSDKNFKAYIKQLDSVVKQYISKNSERKQEAQQTQQILAHLQTHAGAFYISDLYLTSDNFRDTRAGLIIHFDEEDIPTFLQPIKSILQQIPEEIQSSIDIGETKFIRIAQDDEEPTFTWGVSGSYFILAIGEGEAEKIVERQQGSAPEWLVAARQSVEIPRPANFAHLNFERLFRVYFDAIQQEAPELSVAIEGAASAFGIDDLESLAYANGLDDKGSVSRGNIITADELTGLLTLLDTESITATDLQNISADSPFALAFQLNPDDLLTAFLKATSDDRVAPISGMVAEQINTQINAIGGALGIDLREDFLSRIGDTWRIYVQPGENTFTEGWTISIDLVDADEFSVVHQQLMEPLQKSVGIEKEEYEQTIIYSLQIGGLEITPTWCVYQDKILITTSPASIRQLVNSESPTTALSGADHISPYLAEDARTFKLIHVDTATVANFALPMLSNLLTARPGFANASIIPPADILTQYLQPTVIAVQRTDTGFEFTSHATWPCIDFGQLFSLFTAITIPEISNARTSNALVISRNQQKQLSLGILNYESVHSAYPAGYSANEAGKPLLSWRVHILPYLEQQALYEQFHLDEPWDSPHNKKLIAKMPDVYRSPNSHADEGKTTYLGVSGADGVFVRPQPGDMLGIKINQITDGTSNTVMTIESNDDRAVTWTRPGDFAPNKENPQQGLNVDSKHGMSLAYSDGSVRTAPPNTPNNTLMSLFTKSGGEVIQRD